MTEVRRADGSVLNLPSKFTSFKLLRAGDTIEFRTACGGGYGDPLEREPEQVARDVRDQLMSAESALRDYAVVIDSQTGGWTCEAPRGASGRGGQPTVTPSGSTP